MDTELPEMLVSEQARECRASALRRWHPQDELRDYLMKSIHIPHFRRTYYVDTKQRDRERLNQAYREAQGGFASITSAGGKASRMLWNAQMRLLLSMNAMAIFRSYPWLFVGVGAILLAVVLPIGVVWVIVALFALQNEPLAEENFIVEVEAAPKVMTPWDALARQPDVMMILQRIATAGDVGMSVQEIQTAVGTEHARLRRISGDLLMNGKIAFTDGRDKRYRITDEGRASLPA